MGRTMPAWDPMSFNPYAQEEEEDPLLELIRAAEAQEGAIAAERPPSELDALLPQAPPPPRQPMQIDGLSFSPGQEPQRLAAQQPEPPPQLAPAAPPPPEFRDMASRAETPGGARPNYLGHEDEHVYNPDDRIARAGQAYQALPPDQAAQGPGNRWEDEYLNSRKTYSDDDMWRSWMLTTLGGKDGDNFRMRESQMRDRQLYDQGLAHARAQDQKAAQEAQGNQRVSQAMAELAAQSGTISPEAAARMRLNDPAVQGIVKEGVPLGVRRMEMDTNRERQKERGLTELQLAEMNNNTRRDISNQRSQTQLEVADKYAAAKKAGGSSGGGSGSPITPDIIAAHLDDVGNVNDLDAMRRYVGGDKSVLQTLPPERAALIEREFVKISGLNRKEQGGIITAGSKREAGSVDQVATYIQKAQSNPKYAFETQRDMTNTAMSLKKAVAGWNAMSEQGKKAFVQLAPQGWAAIAKSEEIPVADKKYVGAVHGVMNELVKERAGSAVTESEWGRTAAELGLSSGQWDPFQDSQGVTSYLNRARERILQHRKDYERIVKWQ